MPGINGLKGMGGRWGWLLMGALLVAAPSMAAPVYRHVDGDGNVVYSDEPGAGREVPLQPITVVDPAQGMDRETVAPRTETREGDAARYTRFEIAEPGDGETLPTGRAGNVQVRLEIEPPLQPGDRVQLRVDGEVRQSPMRASVFALNQLARGEHRLQAELVGGGGEVRLASAPVTLYVQRASVNLPANPNNPNH
ncbi:DUF4124 domain-containing protein [Salinicola avicenniae]|uniref:DUF4124 domain-containing protein n=1 Tax=Salinicola avicenniae TaxID=2916836 RepID=UPI002072A4FB|nr:MULTISPECIES: DUF4124 domain-containing protein [unclassified Salinicola]